MHCRRLHGLVGPRQHAGQGRHTLRDSVPADLADRLLAPFGWPDARPLRDAIETAAYRDVHVRRAAFPLIFEGGIAQAAWALSASPLAPSLAALPAPARDRLNAAIKTHLAPLLTEERVSGCMTANMALAHAQAAGACGGKAG